MPSIQAQTAATLQRYTAALIHDSLSPRAAPSVELERTARYIAREFERFGLRPGSMDQGAPSWFQRYPVAGQRRLDPTQSKVAVRTTLMAQTKPIVAEVGEIQQQELSLDFATSAYFAGGTQPVPTQDLEENRRTVLVAGRHTAASLREANLRGAHVVYVPPADGDSVRQAELRQELRELSHGLVVLSSADSATFATRVHATHRLPPRLADDYLWQQATAGWAAEVWPNALVAALGTAGVDLAEVRSAATPVVRPLPTLQLSLRVQENAAQADTATVPNVIGRLDGTEAAFRNNPLIISAHIEHTGIHSGRVDTLGAAADHDAEEVAALLTLAQAFSQAGTRPRRPVIFLATSGGGPGSDDWGTNYYIAMGLGLMRLGGKGHLALEHHGAVARDTLWVTGTDEVNLPRPLAWLLGTHPELPLTLVENSTVQCPPAGCWATRSAFAQAWVAGLTIGIGSFAGDGRAAEHAARILRFTYHLADDLANAQAPPRWNAKMRERLPEP